MKKIYLFILLNILLNSIVAQNFEWAKVDGKYAYDYGYGVVTDNAGNVYTAGKYEENAIFSGVTLPNQGNHDMYVARYSPTGNLDWIRTAGGFNGDYAQAIATNKTSNIYVTGEVEDGTALITFPGSTITLTPLGDNDLFIASYDFNGNLQWARTDGYYYNEKSRGITCDNSGNVVVCGYYKDTTMFNGTKIPSKGEEDMFVAKYDANGTILWMRNAGGPGRDEGKSVVCDASGNVYVCGMYSDGAVFGTTTYTVANTPFGKYFDGYIAKYDPNGNLLWVKSIVGDYDDVAWSITKDNAGKIYISGEFSGAKFGTVDEWPNGMQDMFVACYDQNGNYQWVSHGGGLTADRSRGITCDGTTIFATGQFGLNATFGPKAVNAVDSSDVFIAALDNTGNFLWVKTVAGVTDTFDDGGGYESGVAICADPGVVYITGSVLDGASFDNISIPGYTRTDAFLAKLSSVVSVNEVTQNNTIRIYPNPVKDKLTIDYNHDLEKGEIMIYDVLGQIVLKENILRNKQINLGQFKSGLYTYIIRNDSQHIQNGKLIIE